jgi:hypothetical protein
VRVESPAFEGRSFGAVGTYDRIVARATVAVSPDDPHNTIIVDLDRAPRNAQGLVEAATDVEILRPTIAANGNRGLFYEVINRGNKLGLALFNDSPVVVNDLANAADAGNGFLMASGYTIVWSGWQGDILPGGGRMMFSPPVVPDLTGLAREESRQRDLELSRCRSRSCACENQRAPARGRSARDASRPRSQIRGTGKNLNQAAGRFRRRSDLRVHLHRQRPQGDGPRLCRHPRRRFVPSQRARGCSRER